ncbi:MAG: hypothetical protein LBV76_01710 [Deltaproteobacteria bacterium]|jgi:uncharacterized membrane protein YkvI|nr:hypothetical protein [Deltaproteobacteria bacterium]
MSQRTASGGVNILNVIKLTGAYCAFCIGSGYASGQEVMQFFTAHGLYSFGALTISMALFLWFGSAIMLKGYDTKIKATNTIFEYYCGKYIGLAFEIFVPIFLFSVVVIMVSGAGATLAQHYGFDPVIGRAIMAVISMLTVIFGLTRLVQIIGLIGPVIIVVAIIAGFAGIFNGSLSLAEADKAIQTLDVAKADSRWWLSGMLYAAFMVLGSAPFFAGLGTQGISRKDALWGGLLGGFFYIGAAAVMSSGMLVNIGSIYNQEVPALAMAGFTSPWFATLFSVILILGIYSTAAPMLWSVCNRFALDNTPRFKVVTIILGVIAFFGGLLPFGQLVGFIYPKTGIIGLIFMLLLLARPFIKSKK